MGDSMNRDEAIQLLDRLREFVQAGESWHKKGYDFERRFCAMCVDRGIDCVRAGRGHYDFLANGLRVQCKCLVPDANGRVYVQPGSGPAYRPGSFDVLAIETPSFLAIVPERFIGRTRSGYLQAAISASFLARFGGAWWAIDGSESPTGFERQLMLGMQAEPVGDDP